VRVGKPEVKRHDRRLHHETHRDQRERDHKQSVRMMRLETLAQLGEVEGSCLAVDESSSEQDHVRADRVRDREVERSLQRSELFRLIAGERVGGNAHDLEEDEHVEEVAAERESGHSAEEHEHEDAVQARRIFEVMPREQQARDDQDRHEECKPGAEGLRDERDADHNAVLRFPAAEPVDRVGVSHVGQVDSGEHRRRDRNSKAGYCFIHGGRK
jgi:hypothetical protein